MIVYIAYGSNMSAARMKQRLGWEAPRRAATLRDFQLVLDQAGFNAPSWSPANIRSEQGGLVEGMLYEVEEKPHPQEYLNFLLEGKSFLSREYFDELSRIQVIPEDCMKQEHLPES